jgi:GNAT superfamily N-acetyltransferase
LSGEQAFAFAAQSPLPSSRFFWQYPHSRFQGGPELQIRTATATDRAGVLALVPRLRAFGSVPLRSEGDLDAGEHRTLVRFFESQPAPSPQEKCLWVADLEHGQVAGVAYAERVTDYFTQEFHGHLGILMVSEAAEGRGIARSLMATVEEWARSNSFRYLSLNCFAGNERAKGFYERCSYQPDYVRYIKPLRS